MLKVFLEGLENFREYQVVIGGLEHHRQLYQDIIQNSQVPCKVIYQDTYNLLTVSTAALVTSGTATLETALFGVPQIVCYKGNWISYQIAKRLIKVKFISLVNLIMGRLVVTELIQTDCTAAKMADQLSQILEPSSSLAMRDAYLQLTDLLTSGGGAEAAGIDIISDLGQRNI